MRFIVIDLESYYDSEYTFDKLSTEEYVRHSKFELHGAAVKTQPDAPACWLDEPRLRDWCRAQNWSDVFLVSHHAQWDHFALSHHYGVHPKMSGCTLSMARLLLGNHISVSLEAVRKHFGIKPKLTPYNLFKGKHWHEMTQEVRELVAAGACDEVNSIWTIFGLLLKDTPKEELIVIDQVIKMFTEPALQGDIDLLAKVWQDENTKKLARQQSLNVSATELQSADKFAELLRAEGVEPAMKKGKKGPIYAFAKSDPFMMDLLEDENDRVRALAEARVSQKSTFLQKRAERLGWMARRGSLPVYLFMYGAGTLRPSGGDATNFLNLKRNSDIRRALMAPEGYLLGPTDASQIEFRVCNYLAGQDDVIDLLRKGDDPYIPLACEFYQEPIYKPAKDDPRRAEMEMKRGSSKQANLMCIYGAAGPKFRSTAKAGLYGPPVDMDIDTANRWVGLFRQTHPKICGKNGSYWSEADFMLSVLCNGQTREWGPLTIRDHKIYLPNGCMMHYDTLEWHIPEDDEPNIKDFERRGLWRLKTREGWKKMWGSKLVQNVCEAVSRVIVSQAMIRIAAKGIRSLNWPYDELLLLIKNDQYAEERLEECRQEFLKPVSWLPGLPFDAEAHLSERYTK